MTQVYIEGRKSSEAEDLFIHHKILVARFRCMTTLFQNEMVVDLDDIKEVFKLNAAIKDELNDWELRAKKYIKAHVLTNEQAIKIKGELNGTFNRVYSK